MAGDSRVKGSTERREYWRGVITRWRSSGLSQADFCRRYGLHQVTFSSWKLRIEDEETGGPSREGAVLAGSTPARGISRMPLTEKGPRFVELRLGPSACPWPASDRNRSALVYEVMVFGGRTVRVPAGFEAEVLRRLIATVESC
jgi:hypothetical protein